MHYSLCTIHITQYTIYNIHVHYAKISKRNIICFVIDTCFEYMRFTCIPKCKTIIQYTRSTD